MAQSTNAVASATRRLFLAAGPAAAVFGALAAEAAALPPTLQTLGEQFERLWAVERHANALGTDDELAAACDACREIVDRMLGVPAVSLDDLKVKARALSWCWGGKPDELQQYFFGEMEQSTDVKLTRSIIRDLLAA